MVCWIDSRVYSEFQGNFGRRDSNGLYTDNETELGQRRNEVQLKRN